MRKIVYILVPLVFALTIALAALFAGAKLLQNQPVVLPAEDAFFASSHGRALFVSCGIGQDFPSAAGLEREELKAELDSLLDYAVQQGYQAIYFQAANKEAAFYTSETLPFAAVLGHPGKGFSAFDPLHYLCAQAVRRGPGIQVYAVTDVTDPLIYAELAAYPLSGVVADLSSNSQVSQRLCSTLADAVKQISADVKFGIVVKQDARPDEICGSIDLVHLVAQGSAESLEAALQNWNTLPEESAAKLLVWQPMKGLKDAAFCEEAGLRLMAAAINQRTSGAVFGTLADILANPIGAETVISHFAEGGQPPLIDLTFEQELAVYAPTQETIWLDNSFTTYYISGTSDPSLPLTMNGQELERISTNGVWGAHVELKMGKNQFTFAQQEKTATVTIQVYNPNLATPAAINYITEGSRFPTADRVYRAGETITFTCVAPSGSRVVAHIGGQDIVMTQRAATAMWGIPATFGASYTIPATAEEEVVALGQVGYTLTCNGATSQYRSAGSLFAAGRQASIVAEVGQYMTALYRSPVGDGNIAANLNPGTRLQLRGEYQNNRALLLQEDLYVPMADIAILTGRQEAQQHYEFFELRKTPKGEELVLGNGLNAAFPTYEEGQLSITLLNTVVEGADQGLSIIDYDISQLGKNSIQPPSGLFQSISAQNNPDGSATFTFSLLPAARLAGWDACINQDGQAVLYFQAMPTLSHSYGKPLQGITILVDPGHGGEDIGAPGAAGAGGPSEAEVNLALAHTLRYRLQQLGATVVMTQTDNSRITIQERYLMAQQLRPDLYLSVHHNSLAVHRNANEVSFTTAYYFYPQSEALATAAAAKVSQRTHRPLTDAAYAAYYVTRMTYAPSVLFETGFVSNPLEQQDCCDRYTIYQTACGLADAIVQTFEQPYLIPTR